MATIETVQSIKLLIQSTLNGHTPKGLWVAQAIAGEELYAVEMQLSDEAPHQRWSFMLFVSLNWVCSPFYLL